MLQKFCTLEVMGEGIRDASFTRGNTSICDQQLLGYFGVGATAGSLCVEKCATHFPQLQAL
jgi:hypothetical protein